MRRIPLKRATTRSRLPLLSPSRNCWPNQPVLPPYVLLLDAHRTKRKDHPNQVILPISNYAEAHRTGELLRQLQWPVLVWIPPSEQIIESTHSFTRPPAMPAGAGPKSKSGGAGGGGFE